MNKSEILSWLREEDENRLEELWRLADETRRANVGDEVHLRGLVEISNYCVRSCAYCGLHVANSKISRYRMTEPEIIECAHKAVEYGYGTLVMQSGEDPKIDVDFIARIIRRVKIETPLAVTLSLGERKNDELLAWKQAGADRYLLRFETSNSELFEKIHPSLPGQKSDRPAILRRIKALGYETGSGAMIGIPGQTYEDLANDIELFRGLELDMIGVGPYIPHPDTRLGKALEAMKAPQGVQVPNTEMMTYKTVALTRMVCPKANIPSTTALATLNSAKGRELAFRRGANIVMPNLTPPIYRVKYEIYPAKACISETADQCQACMQRRIESIGRKVGKGRGDSPGKR
jgi:biotin synthase